MKYVYTLVKLESPYRAEHMTIIGHYGHNSDAEVVADRVWSRSKRHNYILAIVRWMEEGYEQDLKGETIEVVATEYPNAQYHVECWTIGREQHQIVNEYEAQDMQYTPIPDEVSNV